MWSILKREVKNYWKSSLLWIGIAAGVLMVLQNVSPYLHIHYLAEGETIVNDYPETYRNGDACAGYVPTEEGQRREFWQAQVQKDLMAVCGMDSTKAQSGIAEMKEMDIMTACQYLEKYGFYDAYYSYANTAYRNGTREEINAYMAKSWKTDHSRFTFPENLPISQVCLWDFFATVALSGLFMQDTRKNTYELLHTKPVSAEAYLVEKWAAVLWSACWYSRS